MFFLVKNIAYAQHMVSSLGIKTKNSVINCLYFISESLPRLFVEFMYREYDMQ
jgi:hypothetical protein